MPAMTFCSGRRWLMLVAAATFFAGGCGSGEPPGDGPVTVGLVASLSGAYQGVGEDTRDGFQLYLDAHGGRLGGHAVNLAVVDEADQAATEAMLQTAHPVALTGVTNAETLARLQPALNKEGIPLVSSNDRPKLDDLNLVWTTSFLPDEPGKAIAGYLQNLVHGPVWIMASDSQGGHEDVAGFV